MIITKNQLTNICKYYMFELWGERLEIPVEISGKLSKCFGYFQFMASSRTPLKLMFSKKLIENYKLSTIESVIKHELCHYHLFINNKPSNDGHPIFEAELIRVGGSSTQTITDAGQKHCCTCKKCGKRVGLYDTEKMAKKRVEQAYISRCCGSRLSYGGIINIEDNNKSVKANIKTKSLEEVIKMSEQEINNCINGNIEVITNKIDKVEKINNNFNINDYVKVTAKKPTQGNVYDTLVILIDKKDIDGINALLKLYNKHFINCLKYLSKKRTNYLSQLGLTQLEGLMK